jgi:hypothetical protein
LFGERKDRSRTFALSLPISGHRYEMTKLVAGYLSFGLPWLVLTAAAIIMFLLPPREHLGMVVYALVLQGFVLALFSVALSAMFVIKSEGMSGVVILGTNICFSLFMVTLNQPGTSGRLNTPQIVWIPFAQWMLAAEALVIVLALVFTMLLTSRKRDYI